MTGLVEGLEVVVGQKYVDLTSLHGLACRSPYCCTPQGTKGVGVLLLIHAAYLQQVMTTQ